MGQWWEMVLECHVRRFRFYPESNGKLLEDFKHGSNKVKFTFRKDNSSSRANYIEKDEVRGGETHCEAVSIVQMRANDILN